MLIIELKDDKPKRKGVLRMLAGRDKYRTETVENENGMTLRVFKDDRQRENKPVRKVKEILGKIKAIIKGGE